ncbi:hypothetical protein K523DRAFT_357195 [Schizophyllum commune Tattone D]|nr:hypothetical protein K523DRAFT_357195 [Schizophyllum commune Tattone D]
MLAAVFVADSDGFFITAEGLGKVHARLVEGQADLQISANIYQRLCCHTRRLRAATPPTESRLSGTILSISYPASMKDRPIGGAYDALISSFKVGHVPFERVDRDPQVGDDMSDPCILHNLHNARLSGSVHGCARLGKVARENASPGPSFGQISHRPTHLSRGAGRSARREAILALREQY